MECGPNISQKSILISMRITIMAFNQRLQLMLYFGYHLIITVTCQDVDTNEFEVIFAIPHLFDFNNIKAPRVLITTTSLNPVSALLTVPGKDINNPVTITKYQHASIMLPSSVFLKNGDQNQNKTVIVRSSDAVTVHVMDNEYGNHDGFLALHSSQLGTQYYVASYEPHSPNYPSSICVSALSRETQVQIRTRLGQEHQLVLSAYESFRFDGGENEDLTGTFVQTNEPVAVISGILTYVPDAVKEIDALVEQLLPVHAWGKSFILSPFLGRSSGYIYRVVSAKIATNLQISNIGNVELSAVDGFYEGDVSGNTLVSITSDYPVQLMQYIKGYRSEDPNFGDPSMILVLPLDAYTQNVTFPVFEPTSVSDISYYVNVITNCSYVSGLIFDDTTSMANWNQLTNEDNSMCSVRGNVTKGTHSISHFDLNAKFSVSVYAVETQGSYAYLAGLRNSPQPISRQTTENPTTSEESISGIASTTSRANVSGVADKAIGSLEIAIISLCSFIAIIVIAVVFFLIWRQIKKTAVTEENELVSPIPLALPAQETSTGLYANEQDDASYVNAPATNLEQENSYINTQASQDTEEVSYVNSQASQATQEATYSNSQASQPEQEANYVNAQTPPPQKEAGLYANTQTSQQKQEASYVNAQTLNSEAEAKYANVQGAKGQPRAEGSNDNDISRANRNSSQSPRTDSGEYDENHLWRHLVGDHGSVKSIVFIPNMEEDNED